MGADAAVAALHLAVGLGHTYNGAVFLGQSAVHYDTTLQPPASAFAVQRAFIKGIKKSNREQVKDMNLPNKLTILRICMVPFFVACFFLDFMGSYRLYIAAFMFLAAFLTDAIDGHLARKNNQITDFGKLMDPIADKMLSCSALVMLAAEGYANSIAIIIILSREFLMDGVRLVCADKGIIIAASKWGKLKTASQSIAIPHILIAEGLKAQFPQIAWVTIITDVMLWISVALAVFSAADYILKNRKCFSFK